MTPPRTAALRLDADLHVPADRVDPGLALARAAALGLTDLGFVVRAGPGFDAHVETVRSAATAARMPVHCGLLLWVDGSVEPDPRLLSHVDHVVVAAGAGFGATVLHTVARLRLPVVVAGPVLADLPAAVLARAGVAVEVTERWRTPGIAAARLLAAAGVPLVAGSAAADAGGIGRWAHTRLVAAAVARPAVVSPEVAGPAAAGPGPGAAVARPAAGLPAGPDPAGAAPVPHPSRTRPRTPGGREFRVSHRRGHLEQQ